ncbi:MAG: DUF2974 domain-containing protein, partial [Lachnoclostridium sp.]|nr:DUF2974 domain-containing protein [Lachnoclostridium sp.]
MSETQKQGTTMYTDQELYWATQIAYCDVHNFDMEGYRKDNNGEYPTLEWVFKDLIESDKQIYYDPQFLKSSNLSGDKLKMQESAKQFINDVAEGNICKGWKLVSYDNKENSDGMYAVAIETDDDDAIIAFRGSESVDAKQIIEDWLVADMGIINNELTSQEKSAFQYADQFANQFTYNNIALTGHSLGGDLALTTAVEAASDASSSNLADRIKQSVSFDGPGHTQEFIDEHKEEIHEMQGVMKHYQWSCVGSILKSLCEESGNYEKKDSQLFDSPIYKHSTASLEFDKYGNLKPAYEYDEVADAIHTITNFIDNNQLVQEVAGDVVISVQDLAGFTYGMAVLAKNFEDGDIEELEKTGNYGFDLVEKMCYAETVFGTHSSSATVALVTIGACKTYYKVCKEYSEGNYRTGSKESISFGTSLLGTLMATEAAIELFTILGVAASGPASVAALLAVFAVGYLGGKVGSDAGNQLGDWICDALGYADFDYTMAEAAPVPVDPLVIDFDRDGFELLEAEDGVYFDGNNAGLREKTQWAAPDDALLAIDLNGDGMINDGSELFGNSTLFGDGRHAGSGFEALAQYDENGDGVIDAADSAFSRLLVWQDVNSDGISQADELHTLEELGAESISLDYRNTDGINTSAITFADGAATRIGEFDFDVRLYDSMEKEEVEISEEIRILPNVRAMGNVASLHTLMQKDDTGILKGYVEQFARAGSAGEKEELVTRMLYFITGAVDVAGGSRGGHFDAQKLVVIERFLGKDYVGTAGSNPVSTAAGILSGVYNDIFELYYNLLNGQTALKDYLSMTIWHTGENGRKYLNTSIFDSYVDFCIRDGMDMRGVVADMGRYIAFVNAKNRENFADYLSAYSGRSDYLKAIAEVTGRLTVMGTGENDRLSANEGGSFLMGLEGDDHLYGGEGDDFLHGGKGDDRLEGGNGADTYFFEAGDGNDTIRNYDPAGWRGDRILFGEGVSPEDMEVSRRDWSLVLEDTKGGGRVTLQDALAYNDGWQFVGRIEFADGTVWEPDDIREMLRVFRGTEGDDALSGYNGGYNHDINEEFYGGSGNDTINGEEGDDILYGEEGDDRLYGGEGGDFLHGGKGDDRLEGGNGA